MNKELEISLNLTDISAYVEGALNYFRNENNPNFDKKEMIAYLSAVPEIIENTRELLKEIESEYNKKILELEKRCY